MQDNSNYSQISKGRKLIQEIGCTSDGRAGKPKQAAVRKMSSTEGFRQVSNMIGFVFLNDHSVCRV